jgi:diaminopimelate decarboxylase
MVRFSRLFPRVPVGLRISPDSDDKRGVTPDTLQRLLAEHALSVAGLHRYLGTNILDAREHRETIDSLVRSIDRMAESALCTEPYLNIGGGFGYDYRHRVGFDWQAHGRIVEQSLLDLHARRPGKSWSIRMEIGRALLADCACLIARVLHAYEKGGRKYIVVNTNISHLPRVVRYGFDVEHFPYLDEGYHHLEIAGQEVGGTRVAVVGNSHYSKDWLGYVMLADFNPSRLEGEYLIVHDAGAYTEAMADDWSDEPLPASVFLKVDGKEEITRSWGSRFSQVG